MISLRPWTELLQDNRAALTQMRKMMILRKKKEDNN